MQRPSAPVSSSYGPSSVGASQNGPQNTPGSLGARPAALPQSDPGVDLVLTSIQDIRTNILGLMQHIETQTDYLSWAIIMDRFSLISSQMSQLAKAMKNDRFQDFRKIAIVPYLVSQDPDPAVEKLTEQRMPSVNHENVPICLRTKLDPEVESRFEQAYNKVPANVPEAASKSDKQVQQLNKVVTTLLEQLETAKGEWDTKAAGKSALPATYNPGDTSIILTAMSTGKGLPANSTFIGKGATATTMPAGVPPSRPMS